MNPELKAQLDKLADPIKEAISESYYQHIADADMRAEQKVRAELNEKYDADQKALVAGMDALIRESVESILSEYKAKAKAYGESTQKMIAEGSQFINETLAKELEAIREDHKKFNEGFEAMNQSIAEVINEVAITEAQRMADERNQYIAQRARLLDEGAKAIEERKRIATEQAVGRIADWVSELLESEITELKDDIKAAQKNTFGQKMFERFAAEFKAVFLNENSEIQAMKERMNKMGEKVEEAAKVVGSKDEKIKELMESLNAERDARKREQIFNENTRTLSADKVHVMREMTKNVETDRLDESIKHYMPFVLKNREEVKSLNEAPKAPVAAKKVVITGNRNEKINESKKEVAKPESKDLTEILSMLQ